MVGLGGAFKTQGLPPVGGPANKPPFFMTNPSKRPLTTATALVDQLTPHLGLGTAAELAPKKVANTLRKLAKQLTKAHTRQAAADLKAAMSSDKQVRKAKTAALYTALQPHLGTTGSAAATPSKQLAKTVKQLAKQLAKQLVKQEDKQAKQTAKSAQKVTKTAKKVAAKTATKAAAKTAAKTLKSVAPKATPVKAPAPKAPAPKAAAPAAPAAPAARRRPAAAPAKRPAPAATASAPATAE